MICGGSGGEEVLEEGGGGRVEVLEEGGGGVEDLLAFAESNCLTFL